MRFPYRSIQTACHYKENPPSTHLEAKTLQVYRKNALLKANPKASPKANPKAGPKVRENLYLIILPPWVSV